MSITSNNKSTIAFQIVRLLTLFWLGWTLFFAWKNIITQNWLQIASTSPQKKQAKTGDQNFDSVYTQAAIATDRIIPQSDRVVILWQNMGFAADPRYADFIGHYWLFPRQVDVVMNEDSHKLAATDTIFIVRDPGISMGSRFDPLPTIYKASDIESQVEVKRINQ